MHLSGHFTESTLLRAIHWRWVRQEKFYCSWHAKALCMFCQIDCPIPLQFPKIREYTIVCSDLVCIFVYVWKPSHLHGVTRTFGIRQLRLLTWRIIIRLHGVIRKYNNIIAFRLNFWSTQHGSCAFTPRLEPKKILDWNTLLQTRPLKIFATSRPLAPNFECLNGTMFCRKFVTLQNANENFCSDAYFVLSLPLTTGPHGR